LLLKTSTIAAIAVTVRMLAIVARR